MKTSTARTACLIAAVLALSSSAMGASATLYVKGTFAANERVGNACLVAPGLGGRQPSAAALGPDGNLYVGFISSGDIVRLPVTTVAPAPACAQPQVTTTGKSIKGGRVNGMAFVGS